MRRSRKKNELLSCFLLASLTIVLGVNTDEDDIPAQEEAAQQRTRLQEEDEHVKRQEGTDAKAEERQKDIDRVKY